VTLTGVGFKFSYIVTSTAASLASAAGALLPAFLADPKSLTLLFTLIMTGVVCILMGCGDPNDGEIHHHGDDRRAGARASSASSRSSRTSSCSIYGVLADITPPVALAAYAAAGMAGADPFRTGNTAFRLGLGKVLVPFVFVFSPSLLLVCQGLHLARFLARLPRLHRRHQLPCGRHHRLAPGPAPRPGNACCSGFAAILLVAPELYSSLLGAAPRRAGADPPARRVPP
jgi:hypothetical protein